MSANLCRSGRTRDPANRVGPRDTRKTDVYVGVAGNHPVAGFVRLSRRCLSNPSGSVAGKRSSGRKRCRADDPASVPIIDLPRDERAQDVWQLLIHQRSSIRAPVSAGHRGNKTNPRALSPTFQKWRVA